MLIELDGPFPLFACLGFQHIGGRIIVINFTHRIFSSWKIRSALCVQRPPDSIYNFLNTPNRMSIARKHAETLFDFIALPPDKYRAPGSNACRSGGSGLSEIP